MVEAKRRADFERFVRRTDTCWLWRGAKNPAGYGQFRVGTITAGAHRWAWQWANGPIPDGMQIHHQCHTPACVNPTHLAVRSQRENLQARRYSSWAGLHDRVEVTDNEEPLTVTLTLVQSAWIRERAAETGQSIDEVIERGIYTYMTHVLYVKPSRE
ncbi:MAG TPA: HNH endonuclease signature motif containing protein [Chloroflexota bacterium]|nr:HNH endonuclease signature motif containing protein [Chloroflexota bacterium]